MTVSNIAAIGMGAAAGLLAYGIVAPIYDNAPHKGDVFGSVRDGDGIQYAKLGERVGSYGTLEDAQAAVRELGPGSSYVHVQKGVSILNRERNWVFRVDDADARRLHDQQMTNIGADLGTHNEVIGVTLDGEYRGIVDDRVAPSGAGRYIENVWWK